MNRLTTLANGDIVASTGDGLFRYHEGASDWTQLQPTIVGTISDMIALPGGDLLVAGYVGAWPNSTPLLARYVFAPVPPICPADFNCSGGLPTVADIFAFLSAWFAHLPRADFNGDTQIQVNDIFAFLSAWFAGC